MHSKHCIHNILVSFYLMLFQWIVRPPPHCLSCVNCTITMVNLSPTLLRLSLTISGVSTVAPLHTNHSHIRWTVDAHTHALTLHCNCTRISVCPYDYDLHTPQTLVELSAHKAAWAVTPTVSRDLCILPVLHTRRSVCSVRW